MKRSSTWIVLLTISALFGACSKRIYPLSNQLMPFSAADCSCEKFPDTSHFWLIGDGRLDDMQDALNWCRTEGLIRNVEEK
jgi:hypothetical protein